MADRPEQPGKHESGELVCWWCGYGLEGVDLIRSDLKCPECGKDNVPGNGPDAPHVRRPWPAWWVLAAQVCWPGVLLGLGLSARWLDETGHWVRELQAGLNAAVMPAAVFSIVWPPAITELIVDERVSGMYKNRWRLVVAVGGIAANLAVAFAMAIAARIVAGG